MEPAEQISFAGGALKSPDDPSDWIFERCVMSIKGTPPILPDVFTLEDYVNTPRNQNTRNTCAAFAGVGIKEMHVRRDTGLSLQLSPEFVYQHRSNKPARGMYGRDVFVVLRDIGTVPETLCPYAEASDEERDTPSQSIYEIARKYRVGGFARITTIDGLKRALYEIGPCYLSLPVYSSAREFWAMSPGQQQEPSMGHAVMVIGWTLEGFILQNSWGEDWGDFGRVIFPYTAWGIQWECWVAYALDVGKVPNGKKRRHRCVIM